MTIVRLPAAALCTRVLVYHSVCRTVSPLHYDNCTALTFTHGTFNDIMTAFCCDKVSKITSKYLAYRNCKFSFCAN